MSFVITHPEALATAAGQLEAVGSSLPAQNAAAADEISALSATQFSVHGAMYQAVGAQAAAVHQMFTAILAASSDSYATTEAANAIAAS